jgi:hypothetical protein
MCGTYCHVPELVFLTQCDSPGSYGDLRYGPIKCDAQLDAELQTANDR